MNLANKRKSGDSWPPLKRNIEKAELPANGDFEEPLGLIRTAITSINYLPGFTTGFAISRNLAQNVRDIL